MRVLTGVALACSFVVITPMDRAEAASPLAFTTSKWGNAKLSNWPAAMAVQASGLDAADAICQAAAADADLPMPEQFVAWISDQQTDAYCRLLGLPGRRAEQCDGQLGSTAMGPWVRTDGVPFAESLEALVAGRVLSPLLRNEFGDTLPFPYEVFTATSSTGEYHDVLGDESDCMGWTSDAEAWDYFAGLGSSTGTTEAWTDIDGGVSCNGTRRLVCLQRGQGDPLPPRPVGGKALAFVSEQEVPADLGGITGADAMCVSYAAEAGLPHAERFKALLTSTDAGVTPVGRLSNPGPWYRPDGMLFAASLQELAPSQIRVPLNVTQHGTYVSRSYALTGAEPNGSPSGLDCNGWSGGAGLASSSIVNEVFFGPLGPGSWLSTSQLDCSLSTPYAVRLYCLQDMDGMQLLSDGFEALYDGVP